MLSNVRTGLRAFIDPPRATAFTYVRESKIVLLTAIVAMSVVPEGIFFALVFQHTLWLTIAFALANVGTVLWMLALYGSMAAKPHELSADRVVLHNGFLRTLEVPLGDIVQARSLGALALRRLPRKQGDGSVVLASDGEPIVEVTLRGAIPRIFVASDEPDALCAELGKLGPKPHDSEH